VVPLKRQLESPITPQFCPQGSQAIVPRYHSPQLYHPNESHHALDPAYVSNSGSARIIKSLPPPDSQNESPLSNYNGMVSSSEQSYPKIAPPALPHWLAASIHPPLSYGQGSYNCCLNVFGRAAVSHSYR
jgi:hypothetical protein